MSAPTLSYDEYISITDSYERVCTIKSLVGWFGAPTERIPDDQSGHIRLRFSGGIIDVDINGALNT